MAAGVAADRQLAAADTGTTDTAVSKTSRKQGSTIERFADELGLTDSQRAAIAPVLKDTRQSMSKLFEQVKPAYDELVDSARSEVEAILTPEQVAEYRRLLEREYGSRDNEHGDQPED